MYQFSQCRFRSDDQGAVAVVAAVAMVVLVGAIGLAVTTIVAYHDQNAYQRALDTAVLRAASLPGELSEEERILMAHGFFRANLAATNLTAEKSADISTTSGTTFTIQERIVTGRSTAQVKNLFSGLVGPNELEFSVQSAAVVAESAPVCVLALDPVSPNGIEVYGAAQFTARNCAALANSKDSMGMRQYGNAVARAKLFGVSGGYTGSGFHPKPVSNAPPISDPYDAVPVPQSGSCVDIAAKLQHTPAVLDPGTYCGGIRIMANSTIIMNPGVYVMKDGPFRVDSNSIVTGDQVTVAFTGADSTLYFGSGAIVTLTSPTAGTYKNIQFFQDKASSTESWATILGDVQLTFDGVMYLPTQDVWIGGGSIITAKSPSYILVAEKMWFQDNSIIDVWQENSRNMDISAPPANITLTPRLLY